MSVGLKLIYQQQFKEEAKANVITYYTFRYYKVQ
jgi:hypothetical protein